MAIRENDESRSVTQCRQCGSQELALILDLGHHPPSDAFLKPEQLHQAETFYPLRLVSCQSCGLLQIDFLVDGRILYQQDYPYESSTTATGRQHYNQMAKDIVQAFGFKPESLALDIGSNVGVLLQGFKEAGMSVLGVDPAPNMAAKANAAGIRTMNDFFREEVADSILAQHGLVQVITGTNVFAHMHELHSAVAGMKKILASDGVIVIEAPYALDLIEHLEYDTIYHEHIAYLSVKPLESYFKKFDLELFKVEKTAIHGGSLRYFVGHTGTHPIDASVATFIQQEETFGLYSLPRLQKFAQDVAQQKLDLLALLLDLKRQGKIVVGLSVPAKGNTLLNYCHIDQSFLDFLTEKAEIKVGRYSPGMHIPIHKDEKIVQEKPDYALILAWNFAKEIMANMEEYKNQGGKFIVPIPHPLIIE